MTPEHKSARERVEARILASEKSCEGETASWAERARQRDADLRILLSELDKMKTRLQAFDWIAGVYDDRELSRDQVADELADYMMLLDRVRYRHATDGRLTRPNYDVDAMVGAIDDHYDRIFQDEFADRTIALEDERDALAARVAVLEGQGEPWDRERFIFEAKGIMKASIGNHVMAAECIANLAERAHPTIDVQALLERQGEPSGWRPVSEHDGSAGSVLAICATAYTPTAFEAWFFDGTWWIYSQGGEKQSSGVTAWFPTHWMPKPLYAQPTPKNTLLPEQIRHETGWSAKKIGVRWCVGMTGNLDTVHDAILTVNNHMSSDDHARTVAEWVAETCTAAFSSFPNIQSKIPTWIGSYDYEPTEAMLDAGRWHNHRHNSEDNMVASFKAMMQQAEIDGLITFSSSTNTQSKDD